MNNFKKLIVKGDGEVKQVGVDGTFSPPRKKFVVNTRSLGVSREVALIPVQFDEEDKESEAIANLIAEAFTILKEEDKTPQDLLNDVQGLERSFAATKTVRDAFEAQVKELEQQNKELKEKSKKDFDFISEILSKIDSNKFLDRDDAMQMLNDWKDELESINKSKQGE